MATGSFVTYLRVSTDRQGRSGLGLEAQRTAVEAYLNGGRWKVIKEFVEVESGRSADRPALADALSACRLHRAPLVVAKVDRLTRSLSFLSRLLDAGVDVRFCDLPQIEGPTGRFMLQQMAAVAELEAGMISDRTRKALQAKKKVYETLSSADREALRASGKATQLGGNRGHVIDAAAATKGLEARQRKASDRAADLAPVIAELRAQGATSMVAMARALTERGIPTARGNTTWSEMQVSRVLTRLDRKD